HSEHLAPPGLLVLHGDGRNRDHAPLRRALRKGPGLDDHWLTNLHVTDLPLGDGDLHFDHRELAHLDDEVTLLHELSDLFARPRGGYEAVYGAPHGDEPELVLQIAPPTPKTG